MGSDCPHVHSEQPGRLTSPKSRNKSNEKVAHRETATVAVAVLNTARYESSKKSHMLAEGTFERKKQRIETDEKHPEVSFREDQREVLK